MEDAAHVLLTVSHHKHPDGEHAPASKTTSDGFSKTQIKISISRWMCGLYTVSPSPWIGDAVEASVLQHLAAVDAQGPGESIVLPAGGVDGGQQGHRLCEEDILFVKRSRR